MPDETDANIFTAAAPFDNWRRPSGRLRTTWMKTIQQDLKFNNLSLNEAIHVAQNHPLWRLMSTFGAVHSLLVHATYVSLGLNPVMGNFQSSTPQYVDACTRRLACLNLAAQNTLYLQGFFTAATAPEHICYHTAGEGL